MCTFIVKLRHPDGTWRKVSRDKKSTKLAVSPTQRSKLVMPYAVFVSEDEAIREVTRYLSRIGEFIHDFPHYEIVVTTLSNPDGQ